MGFGFVAECYEYTGIGVDIYRVEVHDFGMEMIAAEIKLKLAKQGLAHATVGLFLYGLTCDTWAWIVAANCELRQVVSSVGLSCFDAERLYRDSTIEAAMDACDHIYGTHMKDVATAARF